MRVCGYKYTREPEVDEAKEPEFHKIIYDPGNPDKTANTGKDYYWISETAASALDADAGPDPSQGLTIAGIRKEITTLLNKQGGIDDGTTIRYYPVFYKTFRLYYKDERGEVIDTVASYLAEGNECSVDITKEYTAEMEGKVFRYWVEEGKEGDADAYKYVKDAAVGYHNTITLTDEATLVPVLADGYTVTFNENDGNTPDGASYTPSQARAFGEFPLEPADPPSWDHFDFVGWFENPQAEEGQDPYDGWAQDEDHLTVPKTDGAVAPTGNITLYAHWTPKTTGPVDYTVKVWLENVVEGGDYVPAGQFVVKDGVEIGGEIPRENLDDLPDDDRVKALSKAPDLDADKGNRGFKYKETTVEYDSENNTAGLHGNTVVNIYYDREDMTVSIVTLESADGPGPDRYAELDDVGTLHYAELYENPDVSGEYYFYRVIGNQYLTKVYCYKDGNNWKYYYYRENGTRDDTVAAGDRPEGFSKIKNTVRTITGKYGRPIQWPYGTSSGEAPYTFLDDLAGTTPKAYLTVGTNRCLSSFNGPDFINNNACVFEQPEDINTIVYIYDESLEDSDKYDFVEPTYLAANRYSLPMYLSNWHEGFAPSEYAEVYKGTAYTSNINPDFTPPTGNGITLPTSTELQKLRWNNNLHTSPGWREVDDSGIVIHADHESYMYYLMIKNKRIEKKLVFKYKDDNGDWQDLYPDPNDADNKNIPVKYGYNLSRYLTDIRDSETELKDVVEEKVYGKVFRGWYLDPDFKLPANDADNLSLVTVGSGDIPLYAKTVTGKYHVLVYWNLGSIQEPDMEFRVENEELLDLTNPDSFKTQRDGYSLVGYYKNYDAATDTYEGKWDFSTPVRADNISIPYSSSEDPIRDTYSDNEEPYKHNTRGVLTLYANWYDENGGFKVEYVKPDGTVIREDPHRYKPGTTISLMDISAEDEWIDDDRFDGWVLKDNNVYVPGDTFEAGSEFADRTEVITENGKKRSISVITVTASYVPGKKTPTHIKWFINYEKEGVDPVFFEHSGKDINEAVDVPLVNEEGELEIPERPGYKFLGWAKAEENGPLLENLTASNLYITYYEDQNTYNYTKVAADEDTKNGYDAFYAVWERSQFMIYHSAWPGSEEAKMEGPFDVPLNTKGDDVATFNMVEHVEEGCLYGGYYVINPLKL